MNRRGLVAATVVLAVAAFAAVSYFYYRAINPPQAAPVAAADHLVRPHSPVTGLADAPVTIVEFFDPACPSCRAFYPFVKRIMAEFPKDVRVVMRYAAYHKGSDEAVRMLEAARLQGVFEPVLEALYAAQPEWADQRAVNMNKAWEAAVRAGLDDGKARQIMNLPDITANMKQDADDAVAAKVDGTPTFFVNGKPLPSFGAEQLYALVKSEVASARAR